VAAWCDVPFVPKALQRGVQRRAFLSDPTHNYSFALFADLTMG
jgi:hypothetical protein